MFIYFLWGNLTLLHFKVYIRKQQAYICSPAHA
jgi:hypothetical protein